MDRGDEGLVFASLSWEGGSTFLTTRHPVIPFGRSASCPIRFGHQPTLDIGVPRAAGQFLVVGAGRVAVENLAEKLAFDVVSPFSPPDAVRPGAIFSPGAQRFEVRLVGALMSYTVRVEVMAAPRHIPLGAAVEDPSDPPTRLDPDLTDRQWSVMAEYIRPILAGSPVPATHAAVAEALGWSMALIRVECAEIWSQFVLAGVPMRDFPDKRDAIVDAVIRHRLLPDNDIMGEQYGE